MDWYAQQQPLFGDDDEDPDSRQDELEFSTGKEFVVYMIDAGDNMLQPLPDEDTGRSYFGAVVKVISNRLKNRIISRESDEVGVCFFNTDPSYPYLILHNGQTAMTEWPRSSLQEWTGMGLVSSLVLSVYTREKKNIQDSEGVYVFSELGIPSAQLIRDTDHITEKFERDIGSKMVGAADSKESVLYNALWVAQAMLRTGTSKNVAKRILIFTNNDDPLEDASPVVKADLRRTTIQRAKDAQDLGIAIELYSFNRPGEQFNVNIFYSNLVQLDDDESMNFLTSSKNRFDDLVSELTKKEFKKRVVRKLSLTVINGLDIGLRSYAMMRPATTGSTIWLDSRTNTSLKTERSYICSDTGAIMMGPLKRFHEYSGKKVLFNPDELQQVKKVTNVQLRLLGFKPLVCLKDYHNLRPPTFLYPDEEAITGSFCAFIAFHRSMLRLQKFALAFYGGSANPQLVALVAQEEDINEYGERQPPGMNMIYMPYSDDIRPAEKYHSDTVNPPVRGTPEQVEKAVKLMRELNMRDFSVQQIQNPALQRHYAILQALALEEDDLPETKDETLPHEKGMNSVVAVKALQEFKNSVYGDHYDEEMLEEAAEKAKGSVTAQKRKAAAEVASKEANEYNWSELADTGKLKELTVVELKYYLTAHKLPLSGKKDLLMTRILTHLGK